MWTLMVSTPSLWFLLPAEGAEAITETADTTVWGLLSSSQDPTTVISTLEGCGPTEKETCCRFESAFPGELGS